MKKEDIIEIEMMPDKDGTFLPIRQYTLKEKEEEKKNKKKEMKKIKQMRQQHERYRSIPADTNNLHTIHATVNQFMEGLTIGLNVLQKFQRMVK